MNSRLPADSCAARRISPRRSWLARIFTPSQRSPASVAKATEFTPRMRGMESCGSGNVANFSSRLFDHMASSTSNTYSSRLWRCSMVAAMSASMAFSSAANELDGDAPAPRPRMNLPPEISCTVAAALATIAGSRKPAFTTSEPSPMLRVTAASAPSVAKHSGIEGAFITEPAK